MLVDHPEHANFIKDSKEPEVIKKEARHYCIAPLEAKYWNRIAESEKSGLKEVTDKSISKSDDINPSLSFNEQTLNYMRILHTDWGIVTDGNTWRLLHSKTSEEAPGEVFSI